MELNKGDLVYVPSQVILRGFSSKHPDSPTSVRKLDKPTLVLVIREIKDSSCVVVVHDGRRWLVKKNDVYLQMEGLDDC